MKNYKLDIMLKSRLSEWFKEHKSTIIFSAVIICVGLIVGVIISLGDLSSYKILSASEENLFNYISGTADTTSIFWQKLAVGLFGLIIIFVCCLNFYTSFVAAIYLIYQSIIFVVAISALIKYYTIGLVIFAIIILIPSNLLLLVVSGLFLANCQKRAKTAHKRREQFVKSFNANYWTSSGLIIVSYIILQIFVSLILPLILRATYIINY